MFYIKGMGYYPFDIKFIITYFKKFSIKEHLIELFTDQK